MGFQKFVGTTPAIGIPGQEVNPTQAVYTAFNYVSDGTVKAGAFAFAVTMEADDAGVTAMNSASATGAAGAKVLGFVERNQIATIIDPLTGATDIYNKGIGLPIALRGQFYAEATGDCTDGQSVLCDPTTGKVTYGAAGAANDTGWIVRMPRGVASASEGDIIIVENFGLTVAAAAP